MDCIKNKNTKELKEMFCEKLLSNYDDIDSDINNFLEFIDGNIVSYNGPEYAEEGAKDNGIWTKYWVEPYTRNIKTDHNKEYLMIYYHVIVYDEEPERVGISEIKIREENSKEICKIGDVYLVDTELTR